MKTMEERKAEYMSMVYDEMQCRGYTLTEIPKVIAKTGFMQAFNEYPEESLHYSIENTVCEIMLVASKN